MAVVLLAGLGTTALSGPANASLDDGICPGMPAPQNNRVGNQAPVLANDTASIVAGDLIAIRPLRNDSDPDGDKLYLVSGTSPAKGEACVGNTGVLEYLSDSSSTNYVQRIRYGVTDGDAYRTATVTFNVAGVRPVVATLRKALGKGKPKRKAIVSFTNPNRRNVLLFAGNPKKSRPTISRTLGAGKTLVFTTKLRRLEYVVARPTSDDDLSLVSFGLLNTRTGHQQTGGPGDFARTAPTLHSSVNRWLQ
jgi:hypothetical protein